jgi:hypothetical protein
MWKAASSYCRRARLTPDDRNAASWVYTEEGRRVGEVQVGLYPHEMVFSPDVFDTPPGAGPDTVEPL